MGISSFKILGEVKKKFGTKKVGHMGTLDPLAEGILPFAVGKYTKLIQYVNLLPKVYVAEVTFGVDSETLDAEGVAVDDLNVVRGSVNLEDFDADEIDKVLSSMVGMIDQVPPVFSALKIDGVRAYDLARKGKEVEMRSRKVECFGLSLLALVEDDGLVKARVRVECGKGYYVRSFVRDMCAELGVKGFMSGLVREKVGSFDVENCLHVGFEFGDISEDLDWENILSSDFERLELSESEVLRLKNGLSIEKEFDGFGIGVFGGEPVSLISGENGVVKVVKNV